MEHDTYLKLAVNEALKGMLKGEGGPFGAVVVRGGEVLGKGHNTVLKSNDPTAHAEVNAIRNACRHIHHYHLTGAVIYTNFEPCPMCLAAIYWADIRNLYYCSGRDEAERIGFMDSQLYNEISLPIQDRAIKSSRRMVDEMDQLLDRWNGLKGKIFY